MKKRLISLTIILSLIMLSSFTFADSESLLSVYEQNEHNKAVEENKQKINEIMDEMAGYTTSKLLHESKGFNKHSKSSQDINILNFKKQLKSLGVESVSVERVNQIINNSKSNNSEFDAKVTVPEDTSGVNWFEHVYTYYYGGKQYELQELYAQGLNSDTNLATGVDGATLYSNKEYLLKEFDNICSIYSQKIIGLVPVFQWLPYELFFGGDDNATVESHIITYRSISTVCFIYVKEYSQSDNQQALSFVSNKFNLGSSHTVAGIHYGLAKVKSEDGNVDVYSTDYASAPSAVKNFTDPLNNNSFSYAENFRFYSPDKAKSLTGYVLTPFFPYQIH